MRRHTIRSTSVLCMLALFASLPLALAQPGTSFAFPRGEGAFFQRWDELQLFGDAGFSTDFENEVSHLEVVPRVGWLNDTSGAAYRKDLVDVSGGFQTKFWVGNSSRYGFALVIKHPDEEEYFRPLDLDQPIEERLNQGQPVTDRALIVTFDFFDHDVWVSGPTGEFARAEIPDEFFEWRDVVGFTHPIPYFRGEPIVRYIPGAEVLDVFIHNFGENSVSLILRTTLPFPMEGNVLDDGMAEIGFTSAQFNHSGAPHVPTQVQGWEFGDGLTLVGINAGNYRELMTFKTSDQTLWNPRLAPLGKHEFDLSLKAQYGPPFGAPPSPAGETKSAVGGTFQAGFEAQAEGEAGLRFRAEVSGGAVDVSYPLFLNLQFPPQRTVAPGQEFTISAWFDPDALASFTTQSPHARFRSSLTLNTFTDFSAFARVPVGGRFDFDPFSGSGAQTNVNDVTFLDTDFIWEHRELFGLAASAGFGLINLQDDEGTSGPKDSHRGTPGKGSTKGAKKGVSPTDFISLNLKLPQLGTTGVRSPLDELPTRLRGNVRSKFVGLHADFTSALMSFAGMDLLPLNFGISHDFGGDARFSLGWHFADLYGDLDFGLRKEYQFVPAPHLRLVVSDGTTVQEFDLVLEPDGKPVETPPIVMSDLPMTITPTVFMTNPDHDPSEAIAGQPRPFNLFGSAGALTLEGQLGFNVFQIYADIPAVDIDLDTHHTPPVIQPLIWPFLDEDVATFSLGSFQLGGFNTVQGTPYAFFPEGSENPVIHLVLPGSVEPFPPGAPGMTKVTLMGENADHDAVVVLDDDPSLPFVPAEKRLTTNRINAVEVEAWVPNHLLSERGVHTLTLVNSIDELEIFRSNIGTLVVGAPQPVIDNLFPRFVSLSAVPVDEHGGPVLQHVDPLDPTAGQYFQLAITGTGFVEPLLNPDGTVLYPGSEIRWNGQALPTTQNLGDVVPWVGAQVPASFLAEPGESEITVFNGGPLGRVSNPLIFTAENPVPVLSGVSDTVIQGGLPEFMLTLTGADFVPGAQAHAATAPFTNWVPVPATYVGPGQLNLELAPSVMEPVAHLVRVTNPGPGGGTSGTAVFFLDAEPPVTTAVPSGPLQPSGWYTGPVEVTLNAADNVGVAGTFYRLSGDDPTDPPRGYEGPFTLDEDGVHTVVYWSVDLVGNVEASSTLTLQIDAAPPVTTAALDPEPNENGWWRSTVTVTLSATDATSGVRHIHYRLGDGPEQTYEGPFPVDAEGVHTLAFWSEDEAGNVEEENSETIRIDLTAPTFSVNADPNSLWPPNRQLVAVTIAGSAADNLSGVDPASGSFSVADSYGQVEPAGSFAISEADGIFSFQIQLPAWRDGRDRAGRTYTITLRALDLAGNEGTATVEVRVPHNPGG